MGRILNWTLALGLGVSLLAGPGFAGALNCKAPRVESEALLCQAEVIKKRRVQTVLAGAVVGALLGNLLAKNSGADRSAAMAAGALAGGLSGYWLSVENEIKKTQASDKARQNEVKVRAVAEAKRQKTSASNLNKELKVALLRSPSAADDPKKREAELAQIAKAANLGAQQAQDSGQGYTQVSQRLNAPVDARPMFAPAASSFQSTKEKACGQMQHPGSYCS